MCTYLGVTRCVSSQHELEFMTVCCLHAGETLLEDMFSIGTNFAPGFDEKKIRPVMPTPDAGSSELWAKGDNVEVLFEEA